MEFENSFTVNAPLQRVWEFLLDIEEVAPCMPGAKLTEVVSGNEYKGTVKVKLGAVQIQYAGTATIERVDEASHTVVLVASGRESRGTGNASTTATSKLIEEAPDRTRVDITSEVNVSGRVAQFGRGIMQDVASRLIAEFARNLEARIMASGTPAVDQPSAAPASSEAAATPGADAPAGDAAAPTPAPSAQPATATTAPTLRATPTPQRSAAAPTESVAIKIMPILVAVARSQVASGLRRLAMLVEPKDRA
jgi:carbon monoxide dehydrogenase subunit G